MRADRRLTDRRGGLLFDRLALALRALPILEEIVDLVQPAKRNRVEKHSGDAIVNAAERSPRIARVGPVDLEEKVAVSVVSDELHRFLPPEINSARWSDSLPRRAAPG